MDIRKLIDNTPMSGYQWFIILIAAFINALDGYDLVSMAFAANTVVADFGLSGAQLGWLLSSALIGVGLGAITLAPMADRFGRKQLIVFSMALNLVGLLLTVVASTYAELLIYRVITGLGIGGILACVTVLTSEFSNTRFRGLAMAIYASGYGLGATLCGLLAANFIPTYGWESVFIAGAVLTAIALVLTIFLVPETPEALHNRGRHDDLQKLARRLGKTDGTVAVTVSVPEQAERAHLSEVLTPRFLRTTLLLWAAFALITMAFNYANQWTPQLLTEAGLSAQQGVVGGIMLSFGGTIGSLIFGVLTTRFTARRILIAFALLSALVLVTFIHSTGAPTLMFAAGVAVGMLLNGCVTGMYTITPASYPFRLRATGMGTALGVSRIGAICGPLVVGYLVDAGWTPVALYTTAAGVAVLAGLAVLAIRPSAAVADTATPTQADSADSADRSAAVVG